MAQSEEFGRLVRDIMGNMGLREAAGRTGISSAYLGNMKSGFVPSGEVISKFVAGFDLSTTQEGQDIARRLFEAGSVARPELDPEKVMQFACDLARLDTVQRMALLNAYRSARAERHPAA